MEKLMCPSCGSNELTLSGTAEYQCAHCGTRFTLMRAPAGLVNVVLQDTGKKQIQVIQAMLELYNKEVSLTKLDLVKAKQLTDHPPSVIAYSVQIDVAERIKERLEKLGAVVEFKPI